MTVRPAPPPPSSASAAGSQRNSANRKSLVASKKNPVAHANGFCFHSPMSAIFNKSGGYRKLHSFNLATIIQ